MEKEVSFEGVIVGFEPAPGYEDRKAIYIQGSYGNSSGGFYVIVPDQLHSKLMSMGVGRMISGKGKLLSEWPAIIELTEVENY